MKNYFVAACLLVASAGHTFGGGCVPADLPTQRIVADMHNKDTDDVIGLYEADAVFIDPEGKRFRGTAALLSLYQSVFATLDSDIVMTGQNWRAPHPNICIETGRYEEHLRTRATASTQYYEGSYRLTYKKDRDGSWRISRQEWLKKP